MKIQRVIAGMIAAILLSGCASLTPEVQHLQQEAEHGNATAMFDLGCAYYYGEGAPQDYDTASKWYKQAAEKGNVDAMYNLGGMYLYGRGVTIDYAEAARWYRMAAAKGDPDAIQQLEEMRRAGHVVDRQP